MFAKVIFCSFHHLFEIVDFVLRYWTTGQKHPHLTNAGKYFAAIITITSALLMDANADDFGLIVWRIISGVISSIYAYYWDVIHDWKLFENDYNDANAPFGKQKSHKIVLNIAHWTIFVILRVQFYESN